MASRATEPHRAERAARAVDAPQDVVWPVHQSACSTTYMVAALRAGVIAVILLGVLALVVLL